MLEAVQPSVAAIASKQLCVRAAFHDRAKIKDMDEIGAGDGGEPMRDDDRSAARVNDWSAVWMMRSVSLSSADVGSSSRMIRASFSNARAIEILWR